MNQNQAFFRNFFKEVMRVANRLLEKYGLSDLEEFGTISSYIGANEGLVT